jgi:hypothetical protein
VRAGEGETDEFDFHECFIAVVEQVACLPRVNADDSKQKLPAEAQGNGRVVLFYDCLSGADDACLQ